MNKEPGDESRRNFLKLAGLGLAGLTLTSPASASPACFAAAPSLIKPPRLKKGDTIALTAPAGMILSPEKTDTVEQLLQSKGYKVKRGTTLTSKRGYFAGDDQLRAGEFNSFVKDKDVQAIITMRGGWGCARLLPLIDFTALAANPKIISGFSDITTLLLAQYVKTGIVGFHGVMGNSSMNDFTNEHFFGITADAKTPAYVQPSTQTMTTYKSGTAEGVLIGGNLTVLCSLLGTDYFPDCSGAIFFMEETEEEPYSIDRLLTQLKLAGVFDKISGIIFGQCTKCEAEEPDKSLTLHEVFTDHFSSLSIPSFSGSMIGHVKDKFTLPVGVKARMNADTGAITILETAVS